MATPLTLAHFGWGVRENALMWTASGLVGTAASLGVGHLPPDSARPSDLLALALAMAAAGPLLMLAGMAAATDGGGGGGSGFGSNAGGEDGHLSEAGAPHGMGGGGGGEAYPHGGNTHGGVLVGGGSMWHPLFWAGFLLFDMGYVVAESMLVVLFAGAVEAGHGGGEVSEYEGEGAFAFGVFNSIGWFLGCALGAIVGNHLFLRSARDMLLACGGTSAFVALALTACRRQVFTAEDAGCLLRTLEPAAWPRGRPVTNHREGKDPERGVSVDSAQSSTRKGANGGGPKAQRRYYGREVV